MKTRYRTKVVSSVLLAMGVLAYPALGITPTEVTSSEGSSVLSSLLGATLPSAPQLAPGVAPAPSSATLADVRAHYTAGDTHRALRAAEDLVSRRRWGRDRDAAWLVIGLIHREAGRHNRASAAFTKTRLGDGPLAPWGAWYEAEQDRVRGKPWVAVRECKVYRTSWAHGHHADACLRLQAIVHAENGKILTARRLAEEYDAEHSDGPISEQVELAYAQWAVVHEPEEAIQLLQELAVSHTAPLTGRVAEELLATLQADEHPGAVVPFDTTSLMSRAISLRDTKRRDVAWTTFEELVRRSADDTRLARWVDAEAESFGWRTREWGFLIGLYEQAYADESTGENAWKLYRALGRAGRWDEAAQWARRGQEDHGGTREWRRSQEEVGRTMMMAGAYDEARDQFDRVKARGGWRGRRGAFFAAFSAHMAGDDEDAVSRFDAIIDRDRSYVVESRYWRASAAERLGQTEVAEVDRAWILETEPWSWYATLVRQADPELPTVHPFGRDGRWPGPELPPPPEPEPELAYFGGIPVSGRVGSRTISGSTAFAHLGWPLGAPTRQQHEPVEPIVASNLLDPPPSYVPGVIYDEAEARAELAELAEDHGAAWTLAPVANDLAAAGLHDLSGPLFAEFYESWRKAIRSRYHYRYTAARAAYRNAEDWRPLFLVTRDHNHTARFVHGLEEDVEDPELRAEILRLAHPLAHDRYVWTHAREHGIDPYLVLGLMRQESTYNPLAVSRAGARGAMQIMPLTGHLLADLAHDTSFTAGDLTDPVLSVGYGITYLGLLMERYDDVYPLAIASYNAGPHNVSAWLDGTGTEMPLDAFVEHIPFRETRNYVKHVSTNYATYLALYAPEGTRVVVPSTPRGNHPEVVDF